MTDDERILAAERAGWRCTAALSKDVPGTPDDVGPWVGIIKSPRGEIWWFDPDSIDERTAKLTYYPNA